MGTRFINWICFVSGVILLCSYTAVFGQTTAAVMDLEAKEGVTAGMANLLSDSLRTKLFAGRYFTIVSRENMEEILKEQKFQSSGCTARECIVEVGQLLGVKKMFVGSIGRLGQTYIINLKMLDVETGKIDNAVQETCAKCEDDELLESIEQVAYKVASIGSGKSFLPVSKPATPTPKPINSAPKRVAHQRDYNEGQKGMELGIGGGYTVPNGDWGTFFDPNFSLNPFLGYRSGGFAVGVESGYQNLSGGYNFLGTSADMNVEILSVTPYLRFGKIFYFVVAGGAYMVTMEMASPGYGNFVSKETKYGGNAGFGFNIPMSSATGLMLDGRYHFIPYSGEALKYFNISARMNFLF